MFEVVFATALVVVSTSWVVGNACFKLPALQATSKALDPKP